MFTFITNPLLPLYSEPTEKSEMVSQILFGEQIEILENESNWLQVKNIEDNYVGWIPGKMINKRFFNEKQVNTSDFKTLQSPHTVCFKTSSVEKVILPGGSRVPLINNETFKLHGENYRIIQSDTDYENIPQGNMLVELAQQYINSPYLWGGKSMFGIDCSGLVQVVYSMIGIQLPRDASQQVKEGEVVDFLSEANTGDLAFFENEEGDIQHVGILVNSHQIIHASGFVKREIIDSQGIISSLTGEYTHNLRVIKHIL